MALAAQGLQAAPSVPRDRLDLQTRDIPVSEQAQDIAAGQFDQIKNEIERRQIGRPAAGGAPTERPGGRTAAEGAAERIAKGVPVSNKPGPAAGGAPTERPGGRTAAEGAAGRIAKGVPGSKTNPAGQQGGQVGNGKVQFPSPEEEAETQRTNKQAKDKLDAQRAGQRGGIKFKDTLP